MDDCATQIDDFIAGQMSDAQDEGFGESGLWDLGEAIHTITDMASPWHTESDGTPTCWGCSKADDARHVWMEDVQSRMRGFQDVFSLKYAMQIAQAVRNAQALFLVVFPTEFDKATKGFAFSLQSWASNTAYIDIAIQTNSIDPSPVLVNEATQCLLGNPAACPDESDLMFQMLISGGSGPTPHISCSIQTHCFTK